MSNFPGQRTTNLVHFPNKDATDPRELDVFLDGRSPGVYLAVDYGFSSSATAAENKTALEAAITAAAAAGGGIIKIGPGSYPLNGPIAVTDNHIRIVGAGMWATALDIRSTSGHAVTFTACQYSGLEEITISAKNVVTTSGQYAVTFNAGCFQTHLYRVRVEYFSNGVFLTGVSSHEMEYVLFRYLTYDRGLVVQGTSGDPTYGWRMENFDADNPYPNGDPAGNVVTWATSTAFGVGDSIRVNGSIWQCKTSGTSAGAGTGPSTRPGTDNEDLFTAVVTDGTCEWNWICHETLIWSLIENYAYSGSIDNAALLNGYNGIRIQDTAATGSSQPKWFNTYGLEIDHSWDNCVVLAGGEGFYATGGWWGSSLQARGVLIDSGWDGETYIGDGTRIVGNWLDGILIQSGPIATNISNNHIALNGQATSNTYHGVNVAAGTTRFNISNNVIGRVVSGNGQQANAININTGASDYYVVAGNIVEGNLTGGVADNGTGSNKSVTGNV